MKKKKTLLLLPRKGRKPKEIPEKGQKRETVEKGARLTVRS